MGNHSNPHILQRLFHFLIIQMIQSFYISAHPDDDSWVWSFTPNGQASIKSAYQFFRKEGQKDEDV